MPPTSITTSVGNDGREKDTATTASDPPDRNTKGKGPSDPGDATQAKLDSYLRSRRIPSPAPKERARSSSSSSSTKKMKREGWTPSMSDGNGEEFDDAAREGSRGRFPSVPPWQARFPGPLLAAPDLAELRRRMERARAHALGGKGRAAGCGADASGKAVPTDGREAIASEDPAVGKKGQGKPGIIPTSTTAAVLVKRSDAGTVGGKKEVTVEEITAGVDDDKLSVPTRLPAAEGKKGEGKPGTVPTSATTAVMMKQDDVRDVTGTVEGQKQVAAIEDIPAEVDDAKLSVPTRSTADNSKEAGGSERRDEDEGIGGEEGGEGPVSLGPAFAVARDETPMKRFVVPRGRPLGIYTTFVGGIGAVIRGIEPTCTFGGRIQIGDILVTIDGRRVSKAEDLDIGKENWVREVVIFPCGTSPAETERLVAQNRAVEKGSRKRKRKQEDKESETGGQKEKENDTATKKRKQKKVKGWSLPPTETALNAMANILLKHLRKVVEDRFPSLLAPDVQDISRQVLEICIAKMPSKVPQPEDPPRVEKLARVEVRAKAARALAPYFNRAKANIDCIDWVSPDDGTSKITMTQTYMDAWDLRAMLMAISKSNPVRAGLAIEQVLKNESNEQLKKATLEAVAPMIDGVVDKENEKIIVAGIRDSIKHHIKDHSTARPTAVNAFVRNVATACLFRVVRDDIQIPNNALVRLIGLNRNQVTMARERAKSLIENNEMVSPLEQKPRKDEGVAKSERMFTRVIDESLAVEPTDDDVLLGSGSSINNHPGSVNFRKRCLEYRNVYEESTKCEMMRIADSLVESIRNDGHRFLSKGKDDLWYVVIGDWPILKATVLLNAAVKKWKETEDDMAPSSGSEREEFVNH